MPDANALAIVGMACRVPGARTPDDYWRNLRDGVESIRIFSDRELADAGVAAAQRADPAYVPACGALDNIEEFDAAFFGIPPREAEILDPQHRIFLELAWEALEDAGCDPGRCAGRIGVYAGAGLSTYLLNNLLPHPQLHRIAAPVQVLMANNKDFVPTRVSYKLNLRGPSVSVNTACSSSLVAIHMACQALLGHECDVAIAGGVGIQVPQDRGYRHEAEGILSPDGHCRAFAADARGTVSGNGAGIVVLKRLDAAIAGDETIRAVILGSAINNDGAAKAGFTAPSVAGQAAVVAEALAAAGVEPDSIGCIEAHGTGTPLGDPIEVRALTQVFRARTPRRGFCAIGSVKSNIGHLDEAAGVAGLIKMALALERKTIPPTLHASAPNPACELERSPFFLNRAARPWVTEETPRRGGVSSFGIGGTNAHVVLEEAPAVVAAPSRRPVYVLPLSARSPAALTVASHHLAARLETAPDLALADVAYTLQTGRRAFSHRRAIVCRDAAEAVSRLRGLADPIRRVAGTPDASRLIDSGRTTNSASGPGVVFMFPGQGAQYVGMARMLYEREATFREVIDDCLARVATHAGPDDLARVPAHADLDDLARAAAHAGLDGLPRAAAPARLDDPPRAAAHAGLDELVRVAAHAGLDDLPHAAAHAGFGDLTRVAAHAGLDLRSVLATPTGQPPVDLADRLTRTEMAQPALFAVEYALARLWMSWGVAPTAMIGHSVGEYVAATLAGVFTLDEALRLVVARGRLMQSCAPGSMIAVALDEAALRSLLDDDPARALAIAAVNGPAACVVSGPAGAIDTFARRLRAAQVDVRPLRTSHAFHSSAMDAIVEAFRAEVRPVPLGRPAIPFVSNVTGTWITAAEACDPAYWTRHLRATVRFDAGIETLARERPGAIFLEVGPGRTLCRHARQRTGALTLPSLPHPHESASDHTILLTALAEMWTAGVPVRWEALSAGEDRRRVPLPTYPFERTRFWIAPPRTEAAAPDDRATTAMSLAPATVSDAIAAPPHERTTTAVSVAPTTVPDTIAARLDERATTAVSVASATMSDAIAAPPDERAMTAMSVAPATMPDTLAAPLDRGTTAVSVASTTMPGTIAAPAIAEWLYTPCWTPAPGVSAPARVSGDLVLFAPASAEAGARWAAVLQTALVSHGADVITVRPGPGYHRHDRRHYEIRPGARADIDALLADLTGDRPLPARFVHLWSLAGAAPLSPDDALRRGFDSLLQLTAALSAARPIAPVRIVAVADGLAAVTGDERMRPEHAAILGPLRVIALEEPSIAGCAIDIDVDLDAAPEASLIEALVAEIAGIGTDDSLIAYRGGQRWRPGIRRATPQAETRPAVRDGGVYLITGGLGSMGLAFAERIAARAQATIVLASRSGLPAADPAAREQTAPEPGLLAQHALADADAGADAHAEATGAPAPAVLADDAADADADATGAAVPATLADDAADALRALCARLALDYLGASGIDLASGTRHTEDAIARAVRLSPAYRKMFDWLLGMLADEGLIVRGPDGIGGRVDRGPDPHAGRHEHRSARAGCPRLPGETAVQIRERIRRAHPTVAGLADLVAHCAAHFPAVLSGEVPGTAVLYPDGTPSLLDQFGAGVAAYTSDQHCLDRLAAAIAGRVRARSGGAPLRILEIGGGTGTLTTAIMARTAPGAIDYTFTDVSQAFVARAAAEAQRRGIEGIRFGRLDISRDPLAQGYPAHGFDMVVGYNVAHTTRDVRETLDHLARVLVPGGHLCLVETVKTTPWDQMIWGLTTGWWAFEDGIRTQSPLLDLDAWAGVLSAAGFDRIETSPEDAHARRQADAGIIVGHWPARRRTRGTNTGVREQREQHEQHEQRVRDRIAAIEARGSHVQIVQADVADAARMQTLVAEITATHGPITGVIHAAGEIGRGPIREKTVAAARRVLRPKIGGARALAAALRDSPPEFLILCSSLAAHHPVAGQVDYCAANAALDAFAHAYTRETGAVAVSIGWGFWQELGMIERAAIPAAEKQRIADEIRTRGWSKAGADLFEMILRGYQRPEILVWPDGPPDARSDTRAAAVPSGVTHPLFDSREDTPDTRSGARAAAVPRGVTHPLFDSRDDTPDARADTRAAAVPSGVTHPLFDSREDTPDGVAYVGRLAAATHWVLDEHRLDGTAVLPGTAYLEMVRAAYADATGLDRMEIRDACFLRPFMLDGAESRTIRLILRPRGTLYEFFIVSANVSAGGSGSGSGSGDAGDDRWRLHARGEVAGLTGPAPALVDLRAQAAECDDEIRLSGDPARPLHEFERRMQGFGPRWSNVQRVRLGADRAVATLELPPRFAGETDAYGLHPALFDNATGYLPIHRQTVARVPFAYRTIRIWAPLRGAIVSRAVAVGEAGHAAESLDVQITDGAGRLLVEVEGYTLRPIDLHQRERQQPDSALSRSVQLVETAAAARTSDEANAALELGVRGSLDTLAFRLVPASPLGRDDVEIDVRAVGLNFIEVLYALGMLPELPGGRFTFGLECAGVVMRTGAAVRDLKPGDAVMAFANSAARLRLIAPARCVARMPAGLAFEAAATLPAAYMTAYTALVEAGRLRAGERVLVHSACGGVGLAAIHVARWIGAEILATAGTEEKRAHLRAMGIGAVMDSRSAAFVEETHLATGGAGVDVVLNSLSGEFIELGLSTLGRGGRFLELGKRDIFEGTSLSLRHFARQLSLHAIDVGPDLPQFTAIWRAVQARVAAGDFPALPYQTFAGAQAGAAFAAMARGRHIGKFVLSLTDRQALIEQARRPRRASHHDQPLAAILGPAAPHAAPHAAANSALHAGPHAAADAGLHAAPHAAANSTLQAGHAAANLALRARPGAATDAGGDTAAHMAAVPVAPNSHLTARGVVAGAIGAIGTSSGSTGVPTPSPSSSPAPAREDAMHHPAGIARTIQSLWEDLLGTSPIGPDDDFFALHGDSLVGAQVVSRLHHALGVKLPLSAIFDHPTVSQLAARVAVMTRAVSPAAGVASVADAAEEEEGVI
jgi:acyl transferase domain-containing protein/NAD(P)-dependent dehydrogenase (short-subunit alcohol dehydrogenase family)